jgi:hypothetical protein
VIDDDSEIVEQWCGIVPPAGMEVGEGSRVPLLSDESVKQAKSWSEDGGITAPTAEPVVSEEDADL